MGFDLSAKDFENGKAGKEKESQGKKEIGKTIALNKGFRQIANFEKWGKSHIVVNR